VDYLTRCSSLFNRTAIQCAVVSYPAYLGSICTLHSFCRSKTSVSYNEAHPLFEHVLLIALRIFCAQAIAKLPLFIWDESKQQQEKGTPICAICTETLLLGDEVQVGGREVPTRGLVKRVVRYKGARVG